MCSRVLVDAGWLIAFKVAKYKRSCTFGPVTGPRHAKRAEGSYHFLVGGGPIFSGPPLGMRK